MKHMNPLYSLLRGPDGREAILLSQLLGPSGNFATLLYEDGEAREHPEDDVPERKKAPLIWNSDKQQPNKGADPRWVEVLTSHWHRVRVEAAVSSLRDFARDPDIVTWRDRRWPHLKGYPLSFNEAHGTVCDTLSSYWGDGHHPLWGLKSRDEVREVWLIAFETDLPADEDLEAAMAVYDVEAESEWQAWRKTEEADRAAARQQKLFASVASGTYVGEPVQAPLFVEVGS